MARPSVVLPEPDSPTTPTVWPSRTTSETPSTAFTCPTALRISPLRMGKCTRTSSTATIGFAATSSSGAAPFGSAASSIFVYGCFGASENLGDCAGFDDFPLLHDGDVVGEAADDAEVVGDEQHRHAVLGLQVFQEREDLRLHRDVERRRRLVGDEQVGAVCKRHGDHHPLALAAGELMRIGAEPAGGIAQPDLAEQLQCPRAAPGLAAHAVRLKDLADLPLDRVQRVERGHRLLEDHGDRPPAQRAQPRLGRGREVFAGEAGSRR